jgi:type I restriction enzyme S subunit
MAKTLYDYWFVQFDFPDQNGKPYKSSGGKMVWSEELKREIPEGWEVKSLDSFGQFKNGINYNSETCGDSIANIINVRDISNSSWFIEPHQLDNLSLEKKEVEKYQITENDILIARSGIPGAVRLIANYKENTIFCGFIIRFLVEKLLYKKYLFFFLKDLEKSTTAKSAGTIMKNVNQDTLKRIHTVLPDQDTLKNFNRIAAPIFKKTNEITEKNQKLAELRDFLLPMLMNGQVRVD